MSVHRVATPPPDIVVILPSEVQELSLGGKTAAQAWRDEWSAWVMDPGNPEREKKYIFSLYSTREILDQTFPQWKDLLKDLANETSPFAQSAYCALKMLSEKEQNGLQSYSYILYHTREALKRSAETQLTSQMEEVLQILHAFCHAKFTQVSMYSHFDDFLSKALRAPQLEPQGLYELPEFTFEKLTEDLARANERLKTAPAEYRPMGIAQQFHQWKNSLGWRFDPNETSHTPYVHSIQTVDTGYGTKTCTVLQHETPTCDPDWIGTSVRLLQNGLGLMISQQAQVIAEYRAYLAAEPGKVTLYVNHPKANSTSWITPEADRSRAVQNLEGDYFNFHFLALPMDGPLWDLASVDLLKKELCASLVSQKNGFAIPQKIKGEDLQQGTAAILDRVHANYFQGGPLDSADLRRAFILLFYSEIKDYLKGRLGVDFMVNVDGHGCAAVDMAKNLVKLGREKDSVRLRELFMLALAPFLMNQGAICLDEALRAMRVLAGLTEEQREVIRKEDVTQYDLTDQTVPQEKSSWSEMVGKELFIACIENMRRLQEKRVVVDQDFETNVIATYCKGGQWDLPALRQQLENDLPRADIRLNRERMKSFVQLCQAMGLESSFFEASKMDALLSADEREAISCMALLHQGVGAESMRDASHYLNENTLGLVVANGSPVEVLDETGDRIFPTQIWGTHVKGKPSELEVHQELTLTDPDRQADPYSIEATVHFQRGGPAKISWLFT